MLKMESNIEAPFKPKISRRYVDDIFHQCKKNDDDINFKASMVTIQTSSLSLKSVQLDFLTQN